MSLHSADRFGTDSFYSSIGRAFVAMCAIVPVLFAVELFDELMAVSLEAAGGIWPRQVAGLDGILFAPFLHADFAHLYGNSVVLIPLGTFVLAAGAGRFVAVTAVVMLTSGLGVWFTGDPTDVVVGASGVIFGYLGFLLARGVVRRSLWNVGVSLLIGLLYGWQLVSLLPTDERVSWQGHLFGFAGGLLAAVLLGGARHRPAPRPPAERAAGPAVDLPPAELPGRSPPAS